MTPPTPAAVRAAMTPLYLRTHADCEELAYDPRDCAEILRDHIHALAANMRANADSMPRVAGLGQICPAKLVGIYADKLEGK